MTTFEEQSLKLREIKKQGLNTFTCCFDRRIPSVLEYFGYMFHHSMLLAGPACTFNDYIDFIEGRDIARATEQVRGMSFRLKDTKVSVSTGVYFLLRAFFLRARESGRVTGAEELNVHLV